MKRSNSLIGRILGLSLATFAGLSLAPAVSHAEEWPSRPIKMIVGFPAGGSPDIVGRLVADKLAQQLGQTVYVDSKVGASGVIASDTVSKSTPDGYTMVMLTGAHSGTAATRKSLPYDPVTGFSMISLVAAYPLLVVVRPDSPIKSFRELLEKAKAEPDKISVGSNAPGSVHHLLGELINIEAGVSMTQVPYRGDGQSILDLTGGRIDVMIGTATTLLDQVNQGALRAIAVSSPERYPLLPDVPTIEETLPGVEAMSWLGLAMAPKTPQPIIDRVNRALRVILATPDIKARFAQLGAVPTWSTPEQMAIQITGEVQRWTRVVEQKNIERQ